MKKVIANCSFGKDSTAMVLRMVELGEQLDFVVFVDLGMEFDCIYRVKEEISSILNDAGVTVVTLKPETSFLNMMCVKSVKGRDGSYYNGYGWCRNGIRYGTSIKQRLLTKFQDSFVERPSINIGIAADEPKRIKEGFCYPLVEWGMTEKDCLNYCYEWGIKWNEQGKNLYDYIDRVSCWCCGNKNLKELQAIHDEFPLYWDKLLKLEKINGPYRKGKYLDELIRKEH